MKCKTAFFITVCLLFLIFVSKGQAGAKESNTAPMAVVPQTTIEFSPVIAGAEVQQRFSVSNSGNALLNIINVYSG